MLGLWPDRHPDFSNLTSHGGGFIPHGAGGVFAAIVVVIFSMVGAEVATIAAGETPNPERAVQRATNAVAARIAIFFVGSVFLLVVILPWNAVDIGASPYVAALKHMGIRGAGHIMNAIVLTAVLSCLKSGLYTGSRMLFVLAARREAPVQLMTLSTRGVPYFAIVCSSVVGFFVRDHGLGRAGIGIPLSAELAGRHRVVRLLVDRALADRAALADTARKIAGQDVVLPGAVDPDARRDHRQMAFNSTCANSFGSAYCPGP